MTMERMDDLQAFLAIVEAGGLSAAARRLDRSLQSVSRSLIALERGMGVELIRRTTRQSRPTEAGLAFYRRVQPAFAEIRDARLEAANRSASPSGVLRIGGPVLFSPIYLVPVVAGFMARYPQIEVELRLSDRFVDLDGNLDGNALDLSVRIGELPDSTLRARRLGALRRVVFGAPAYFAAHGRPTHPDELARHQCIVRTLDGDAVKWPFLVDGRTKQVRAAGRFRTDHSAALYAAVSCGLGLGLTPLWQIRDLVDRQAVELILTEYELPPIPIHAVWPGGGRLSAAAQLFKDFLADRLDCAGL
jgi:DNA-binding transcriptional LysR family regulator